MAEEKEKSVGKEQKSEPVQAPVAADAAAPAADAAAGGAEGQKAARKPKGKAGRHVPIGIVNILASFNNTIVSITDPKGAVVGWSSAGRCGFKGSRKSTAYAATLVAQEASKQAVAVGMHEVEVRVQGPGAGRESAIRAVQAAGLNVTTIKDITPMPHNGCRPPKRRRV